MYITQVICELVYIMMRCWIVCKRTTTEEWRERKLDKPFNRGNCHFGNWNEEKNSSRDQKQLLSLELNSDYKLLVYLNHILRCLVAWGRKISLGQRCFNQAMHENFDKNKDWKSKPSLRSKSRPGAPWQNWTNLLKWNENE